MFGSYFDHIPNENSDVINIDFVPEFITTLDLTAEGRKIYAR